MKRCIKETRGLLAGLALTLRYFAGGRYELQEASRIPAGALLGLGLGIATVTGLLPLLFGGQVLQSCLLFTSDAGEE